MDETQINMIADILISGGSITSMQAFRLGITRLSAIIYRLKKRGMKIQTTPKKVQKRNGKATTIAVYSLIENEDGETA